MSRVVRSPSDGAPSSPGSRSPARRTTEMPLSQTVDDFVSGDGGLEEGKRRLPKSASVPTTKVEEGAATSEGDAFPIDENPPECKLVVHVHDKKHMKEGATLEFQLSQFRSVHDLLRRVGKACRKESPKIPMDAFTKGRLRLEGSSVSFTAEHPIFFLVQLVPRRSADRHVRLALDTHPQRGEPYAKSGWLQKEHGAGPFRGYSRRHFAVRGGEVRYGKDEDEEFAKKKPIDMRSFYIIEDKVDRRKFTLSTPGRDFALMGETEREARGWVDEFQLLWYSQVDQKGARPDKDRAHHCSDRKCDTRFGFFKRKFLCVACEFAFCEQHFVEARNKCAGCARAEDEARGTDALLEDDSVYDGDGAGLIGAGAGGSGRRDAEAEARRKKKEQAEELERLNASGGGGLSEDEPTPYGVLQVQVVQANNVMASDRNGLSDPYAIVFFEGAQYRTKTIDETLNPVWKEVFSMRVRGEGHGIYVALFDADVYMSDDFLGLVYIPLHTLQSGKVYDQWYPLQRRPGKYGRKDTDVRGSLHLQVRYTYDLRSLIKPIAMQDDADLLPSSDADAAAEHKGKSSKRKGSAGAGATTSTTTSEGTNFAAPPKFSMKTIGQNVDRLTALIDALQMDKVTSFMDDIFEWKNPAATISWMILYVYACIYVPSNFVTVIIPMMLLFFLCTNYVTHHFNYMFASKSEANARRALSSLDPAGRLGRPMSVEEELDSDSDGSDGGEADEEIDLDAAVGDEDVDEDDDGVFAGMRRVREKLRTYQNKLGDLCELLEKFQAIMTWRDPVQSSIFMKVLAVATVALMFVPIRLLLLAGGLGKFTGHLRKRLKAIKIAEAENTTVEEVMRRNSGNPALNFLKRAPFPWDNEANEKNLPKDLHEH